MRELEEDLKEKPGAIVLSVGGGGLLNGVVEGLRRAGWDDVPIVAMETLGAHSLNATVQAGELVTLPAITRYQTCSQMLLHPNMSLISILLFTYDLCGKDRPSRLFSSIATTLGLRTVSAQTLKLIGEHTVLSEVVTDQQAVEAADRFVGEYDLSLDTTTNLQMPKCISVRPISLCISSICR